MYSMFIPGTGSEWMFQTRFDVCTKYAIHAPSSFSLWLGEEHRRAGQKGPYGRWTPIPEKVCSHQKRISYNRQKIRRKKEEQKKKEAGRWSFTSRPQAWRALGQGVRWSFIHMSVLVILRLKFKKALFSEVKERKKWIKAREIYQAHVACA